MAAAAFKERNDDDGSIFLERFDEVTNERAANQGMIHGTKEHAGSSGGEATNCRLNRTDLAAFPIGVDNHFLRRERNLRGDDVGVGAQDDSADADARVIDNIQQMLKERAALVGEQSLWRTHAARGTARKDYGGEHF